MKNKIAIFFSLLVSLGCAQTTALRSGYSNEAKSSGNKARVVPPSWESFLKLHDDVVASHKRLVADRDKVIGSVSELAELASASSELEGDSYAKLDEAEKSIRAKKANESLEKYYKKRQMLADTYGLPFKNLLDRAAEIAEAQSKGKKSKAKPTFGTPWVIRKAFAQIEDIEKANYGGTDSDKSPFVKPSCVGANRKFNQSCLKPWINACAKTYKSVDESLYFEGIGEDWSLSEIKVESAAQYPSCKVRGADTDDVPAEEIVTLWGFGLVYNGCGWLASQGYDFNYTGTLYPLYDLKGKWEEMAEVQKRGRLTAADFNKICPRNPDHIAKSIKTVTSDSRVWKNLKELGPMVLEIARVCEKSTHSMCSDIAKSHDKFSLYYATKSCDIRAVTQSDIESDLKSWDDNEYLTEAAKQSHLEMKSRLAICETAADLGYTWNFVSPTIEKGCKAPKK